MMMARFVGGILSAVATLLLVGVNVRDASACSLATYPVERELFPAEATLDVPRNARFTVRYQHLQANQALEETATIVVRDRFGENVDLQIKQGSQSTRLVIATPTQNLEPNTEYEILLLPFDCYEYQADCFGRQPEKVATITTGSSVDDQPPLFLAGVAQEGGVYASSCFDPSCTCDFDFKVVYKALGWPDAVDGAASAPGRVRYNLYIDGVLAGGNQLVNQPSGTTGILCTGIAGEAGFNPSIELSTGPYTVRAVDLAGNETQHPQAITLLPYDCTSDGDGAGTNGGGCGCTSGRSATSTAASYGFLLLFLAWSGRYGARR